jgi:hypothetical protein
MAELATCIADLINAAGKNELERVIPAAKGKVADLCQRFSLG